MGMGKEQVMWAVKIGDPDYMEQIISTNPAVFKDAKKWAIEHGFDRFRTATIDLSKKPDFVGTLSKDIPDDFEPSMMRDLRVGIDREIKARATRHESIVMSFDEFSSQNENMIRLMCENTGGMSDSEFKKYMIMQSKWLMRQAVKHDPPLSMPQAIDQYSKTFRELWDAGKIESLAA